MERTKQGNLPFANPLGISVIMIVKVLEDGSLKHSNHTITRRYCIEHVFDVDTEKVCRRQFGEGYIQLSIEQIG